MLIVSPLARARRSSASDGALDELGVAGLAAGVPLEHGSGEKLAPAAVAPDQPLPLERADDARGRALRQPEA